MIKSETDATIEHSKKAFPIGPWLILCTLLSIIVFIIAWRSINSNDTSPDASSYRALAYNMARYGTFALANKATGELEPTLRVTPLYSLYLAGVLRVFTDMESYTLDCLDNEDACEMTRLLLNRAAIPVYLALLWSFAAAAFLMIKQTWLVLVLLIMLFSADYFRYGITLTELPAALCLLLHATGLYLLVRNTDSPRDRFLAALASGLGLGLLILIKAIFLYWLLLYGLGLLLWGLWRLRQGISEGLRSVLPYAALAMMALLILMPWLLRNGATFGEFRVAGGDSDVLAIRAEFTYMTGPEFLASFAFYATPVLRDALLSFHDEADYLRFQRGIDGSINNEAFYTMAADQSGRVAELAKTLYGEVNSNSIGQAALVALRENWVQQIGLTATFAWRGAFLDGYLGSYREQRYLDSLFQPAYNTYWRLLGLVMAISVPAMLALSAWALTKRDWALLLFFMPALYSFGAHAFLTHYIARYSAPLVPIFLISIGLLIYSISTRPRPQNAMKESHAERPSL